MRIEVDQIKCTGAGICVKRLPSIFRFQEGSKKATVLVDKVPAELETDCLAVAAECPSQAILVHDVRG